MKYHISINQAQAAKICPDLDFNDLAIYDFIKSFATSGNCTTIYDGGKVYYWVSHAAIMDELPLLHIKSKTGIIARINKLVSAGILEKYVKCSDLGKSFYTFGSGAAMLETSTPPTQKNTPLQKNIDPPTKTCRDPLQKNAGNYNINDNINKDNNNVVGFENPPTLTPDNIINVDVEEITGDPITVTTETITPPSSAAPPLKDEANPNKKTLFLIIMPWRIGLTVQTRCARREGGLQRCAHSFAATKKKTSCIKNRLTASLIGTRQEHICECKKIFVVLTFINVKNLHGTKINCNFVSLTKRNT